VIPVLFGGRARPLVGVFLPAGGTPLGRLAVICPPFGIEFLRTERALRILAERLSAAGLDVLRFDWYGTGDSGGEHHEVTVSGAAGDLRAAVEEGLHLSGVANAEVVLVGHRHGVLPAALVAGEDERVTRLVLWDPVSPAQAAADWRACPETPPPGAYWADGFPISAALMDELMAVEDVWTATDRLPSLTVLTSTPMPGELLRRTTGAGWPGRVEAFDDPGPWQPTSELGVGAVPGPTIATIVGWCS
jgi:alpha/beta superfamily hydrolase